VERQDSESTQGRIQGCLGFSALIMAEYSGGNRRNGDANIIDLRKRILGVSRDLVCLKEQVEKYIPILDELAKSQQLHAVIVRTSIVTAVIVLVTGAIGFVGYSILERARDLIT
jgi:hypothetical protein